MNKQEEMILKLFIICARPDGSDKNVHFFLFAHVLHVINIDYSRFCFLSPLPIYFIANHSLCLF